MKIVDAISNTDSIEEAKVIFETLQSAVGLPERKKSPKSLSEVVARKRSTLLTNRKTQNSDLPSPTKTRMQKLAGIKK